MDTTAVRAELEASLAQLIRRHERIDNHLHNRDREVPQDFAEQASFAENDEVLEALEPATRDQIAALRQAIERIDAGTWTTCARCEEPIAEPRLRAMPTSPFCVTCAA